MKTLELTLQSTSRCEMIEITQEVRMLLGGEAFCAGSLTLFTPHTTAAITINENADPDVTSDMLAALAKMVPRDPDFRHREGNSDAHLKSSLIGVSETLLFAKGELLLGTWQGIYFCEFDGPRQRRVLLRLREGEHEQN